MTTILTLRAIVKREYKATPSKDRRRKMNRVIASYFDDQGNEYRKSFESYSDPIVPERGTHVELNRLAKQWS